MQALIIGDSHAEGVFGMSLRDLLVKRGYTTTLAGVGSSAIKTWLNKQVVCHPDGSHCVDQSTLPASPDLLVVVLGTNDAANASAAGGNQASKADANVQKLTQLVAKYSPAQFLWVGPPWLRDNVQHYTNLSAAELYDAADRAGVPVYDSRVVTKPLVEAGSGDGVHLGPKGAKEWAKAVDASLDAAPPAPPATPSGGDGTSTSTSTTDGSTTSTTDEGPSAFLVGALLAAAVYFLYRSSK